MIWRHRPLALPALLSALLGFPALAAPMAGAQSPQALIDEINDCIDRAQSEGTIAVHVEQRAPERAVFSLQADRPMTPASNNKLQTTAAALHHLGADHRWTTRVLANGPVDASGCLRGDLIVVGGGDPTISGRFNGGRVLGTFEEWAERLRREHGIRSIAGRIIGDDDLFDDELFDDTWFMGELAEWYSAESSALSFNDNCVDIHWTAGPSVGSAATHVLDPPTRYVDLVSRVTTCAAGTETDISYQRAPDSNRITAEGGIPAGTSEVGYAAVHNPTLYAVTVLRETLSRRGITVLGEAADIDDLDRAAVRHDLRELCTSVSPPLRDVIAVINQNSQNFYADMLLKTLGQAVEGEGSFDAGARVVGHFLAAIGARPEGWRMVDGSGLSPQNRTTARCLVRLLRWVDAGPDAEVFRASLARGRGERGTLRSRFGHSRRHREAAARILGKSGYLGGVWSLSGIATNRRGVEFYYSIILNGYRSERVPPMRLIDDIAVAIAASEFPADAPLDPEATLQ